MSHDERLKLIKVLRRFPEFDGSMGIGTGLTADHKFAIYVYGKTKKCLKDVPDVFEGYPVIKRAVGRVRPLRARS